MSFWMTPQQIYDELTNGPGSETLAAAQKISYDESRAEQERADRIRRLASTIEGGWQGSAADGAQGAARPLARNAAEGAEYLYLAQDLLDRQTGSFHRAAASVEPIPAQPAAEMLDQVVPFDIDTDAQTRAYQEKAQHNIRVFEGYDNASNHNETCLPQQFSSTNHSGGGVSVTPADTIDVEDSPRSGERVAGPGNYSAPGGAAPRPQPTAPSDFQPAPVLPATQQPVPTGSPTGGLGGGGIQDGPGSTFGGSTVPGGATVQGGSRVQGGLDVRGNSGGPGGSPGVRGGPGGSTGARGPGGSPGSPGAVRGPALGPGIGAGTGAVAAEEAAARRAITTTRSTTTSPMTAPMSNGRNKEDDQEHTRKVLIEADAESVFGSEELTAPQVIGDDEYDN